MQTAEYFSVTSNDGERLDKKVTYWIDEIKLKSQSNTTTWLDIRPALPERSFKPTVINTFIHIEILVFLRMLQSTS